MARGNRLRRWLHPLYRRLETSVHPLRYLFVEITQRCNLACRHCGSDCTRDTRLPELTSDEWLAFFRGLPARFDRDRLVLIITGGEPLCHPELDRILGGVCASGLSWGMVSNGFNLSQRNVERLLDHGITSITVSLDGLQESHDWLRGRAGSFARALAGIEALAAAGVPFFDVVTCVHPHNLDELPAVRALLAERGVPQWRLFCIFPKGRARENQELLLEDAGFARLLHFIRAARQQGGRTGMRVQLSCEGYLPAALDAEVRDEPYFCRAGISIASVLCDGSIAACPNITRTLVQGNVRQDDLREVWQRRFAPFRERAWMRTADCHGCREWARCQGNSMHLWDAEAGRTCWCTYRAARGG